MSSELAELGVLLAGVAYVFIVFVVGMVILKSITPSVSHHYRKYLTNVYVSSVIRKKAKEQGLDLDSEEKNLLIYEKENKRRRKRDLDDRIEDSLADKIEKEFDDEDLKEGKKK